jgi:hypothetical protein
LMYAEHPDRIGRVVGSSRMFGTDSWHSETVSFSWGLWLHYFSLF